MGSFQNFIRVYPPNPRRPRSIFQGSLTISLAESEETKLWLVFALDCAYMQADEHKQLSMGYDQVSAMLWTLIAKWETHK